MEGRLQNNCAGLYPPKVGGGRAFVYRVTTRYGISLVELDSRGRVVQHEGPNHTPPPGRNEALTMAWANRIARVHPPPIRPDAEYDDEEIPF